MPGLLPYFPFLALDIVLLFVRRYVLCIAFKLTSAPDIGWDNGGRTRQWLYFCVGGNRVDLVAECIGTGRCQQESSNRAYCV